SAPLLCHPQRCASDRLPAKGRNATIPDRPDGRNVREADCRCAVIRDVRCPECATRRERQLLYVLTRLFASRGRNAPATAIRWLRQDRFPALLETRAS